MQHRNNRGTVSISQFGCDGMYMLPVCISRETRFGKGCNLMDVLPGDSMISYCMTKVGNVIDVEITELVLYNRVKFCILVKREYDDVFTKENPFFLGQVLTNIMHRVVEYCIDGLPISFFPFFI